MSDELSTSEKIKRAIFKIEEKNAPTISYPVRAPSLMNGVVPAGISPKVANDSISFSMFNSIANIQGFPGYAVLASFATRAEYRAFANALSTEITREWIDFTSKDSDGEETENKIKELKTAFEKYKVRSVIQQCIEQDCYFGRAQILINMRGGEGDKNETPLIISNKTIKIGDLIGFKPVEATWTTPSMYNSIDPSRDDFYKPVEWFMLGQKIHASRLLTIITRPVPDILKAAFNFGGISLSQLAEPYVNNWLRTRQSVSDLISNFSITCLATSMDQVLTRGSDGNDIVARAELFTASRDNLNLMLLDKEREELIQVNTPLSGLYDLQQQSQEQMCSVSNIPAIKLTGVSKGGLNVSSEGEIQSWDDRVSSQQESYWKEPINTMFRIIQLSLWGEIDENIGFKFMPLRQMSKLEESQIRLNNANTANIYLASGVISSDEERQKLDADEDSGYEGLGEKDEDEFEGFSPENEIDPSLEQENDGSEKQ
jgi:phage-related protein (TIGR01555 family)